MKIVEMGKYLRLYPEDGERIVASRFLGYKCSKNEPYITVEHNIVNDIILGRFDNCIIQTSEEVSITCTESLESYQIEDVRKMVELKNVLNRNPMGLGKTVEAIRTMKHLKISNALIVAPKIILSQWQEQFKKWWPEKGDDIIVYADNHVKINSNNIVIINYEKLLNITTLNKLCMFSWDILCVDEAHKIKNPKSKRTIAIKTIPARKRIALTGTPILNRPDDLWSLLHFLDPYYSGISYWNFTNYFCDIKEDLWGRKPQGLTTNPYKIKLLTQVLQAISVYNTINVAQGKTREIVALKMSKVQAKLYKDMKNLVLDELPENATIANGAVLTTRVIQVTSWPGLFIENENGPKFEWICEVCENNPDEKFVVYTRFEKTSAGLHRYLRKYGIQSVQLTGSVTERQRVQNKEQFIQDKDTQVLIGTIAAMGTGTDGLQQVSHICIFIERDWSPEIMNQCEDRLNRKGQQSRVISYILECEKSFDQKVGRINIHKAEDIKEALGQ